MGARLLETAGAAGPFYSARRPASSAIPSALRDTTLLLGSAAAPLFEPLSEPPEPPELPPLPDFFPLLLPPPPPLLA